jgi:hypothetical protein
MFKKKENFNLLELHPVKNSEFEENNGIIELLIPKFTNKILVKYLVPKIKRKDFKVTLDEVGSAVWQLIDGNNSVTDIAVKLKEKFGPEFVQPEERVSKFLMELHKGTVIKFNEFQKGE